MNKQDLDEFLTLLNNYYLEYRTNLGINNNYTFGSEIETEYVDFENLILNMNNLYFDKEWDRKKEVSLIQGIEINSPILKDYDEKQIPTHFIDIFIVFSISICSE